MESLRTICPYRVEEAIYKAAQWIEETGDIRGPDEVHLSYRAYSAFWALAVKHMTEGERRNRTGKLGISLKERSKAGTFLWCGKIMRIDTKLKDYEVRVTKAKKPK